MPHPIRRSAALLLAAALAACDSPTGKGSKLPVVSVDAPVEARLEAGATDEYLLVAGQAEFRLMLHARSGNAADTIVAAVVNESGAVLGMVRSVGTDTSFSAQATGWLSEPGTGKWRVQVRGQSGDDAGAYTLRLFTRNPAPERVPAAVTLGRAVEGEALDVDGDVDEFTVQGTAGQEVIVFAQALGEQGTFVNVELLSQGESVVRVSPHAPSAALEAHTSGRIILPRTGTYMVRVSASDPFREQRGPYRFRIDAVNRAPETASASMAMGTIAAEAIGSVGDVDEFTFNAASAGQEMVLLVQLQQGMTAEGLKVELLRGTQLVAQVVADSVTASLDDRGTGRITLAQAGPYTIRVSGHIAGTPETTTGTYRLELYPVDRRAEAAGEIRIDGASVSGVIDRPGDVDEYELPGTAGQLVVLHGTGAPVRLPLQGELLAPDGSVVGGVVVRGATPSYGWRVRLPVTGTYRLRVASIPATNMGSGPFTIGAYTVSPAPEHVPATLALGQTITEERIDRPGDLDVFTFTGQEGRIAALFMGAESGAGGIIGSVRTAAQQHAIIFTSTGSMTLDASSTGRIPLESTGYVVTVDPQMLSGSMSYAESGAYALRLFEVDTRPEVRPVAYVLGDTVRGEPLYPSVDVDVFRFEVASATPVRLWFNAPGGDPANVVFGVVRNADTGEVVHGVIGNGGGINRDFTLPPGRYTFTAENSNLTAPSATAGSTPARQTYRFAITPR